MTLALHGGDKTIVEGGQQVWPKITEEMKNAVLEQMDNAISLYNRSGIYQEFEDKFAKYHNREYGLLVNSGTSALFSMFEGIHLQPGDEVICPTYTFFATISPIVYTGATPVFCDCGIDGNICPSSIESKITENTKALIVTHMWGIPCNMDKILKICIENNILLLEDCSHAHGARFKGKLVGTFGNAAAWSLQGKKIISAGEGGIMLTDDEDILYRATLQGHFNKRCREEIPQVE